MLGKISLHHVSLNVKNLEQSKNFYQNIIGLKELERPNFGFPGAWYEIGSHQLHLIVEGDAYLEKSNNLNSKRDHFAIRVESYFNTLAYLKEKKLEVEENPMSKSGFAQIFCKDPDGNLIEFHVERESYLKEKEQ
ncbi:hypothetical protein BTS2_1298 [Bacillus sp. TS-2]|nr:hypothetical protein BTS2_1298 [Bacillus sp. TS-2]